MQISGMAICDTGSLHILHLAEYAARKVGFTHVCQCGKYVANSSLRLLSNMVNSIDFVHAVSKCGIYHVFYRCKLEFAIYLPH